MNRIKKYYLPLGIMFGIILIPLLFIVILNYANIINRSTLAILKISIVGISFFVGGFIMGHKSNQKGWLAGLKIGGSMVLLFFLINLLFIHHFHFKYFIYYIILISSSIFGSIIGINKKEQD